MSDIGRTGASLVSTSRRVLLFCLLLLLAACAGMGAVNPQKREGIRTIGIISALPDVFHVQKIGLVVFLNDLKEFSIGKWGIDDYMTGRVRTILGKRYDVRPVTYQRDAIASASEAWGGLGEKVRPYISTQGLDAYVVIRGRQSGYANTNQVVEGFGILDVWGLQYFAFALYHITLLDGREFSRLGQSAAVLPAVQSPAFQPIAGPHVKVDQSWWPPSLDAGSNPRLKTAVIDLIDQSLPDALKRIQLVD